MGEGGSAPISENEFEELFDFEKVSFEDFPSDTSYGEVAFERHVQYSSDKAPQYLVTNWEFSDELSGLWSASAYYVSKNDAGNYDWSTWSQNNNYRYYDDLVNFAQELDSFDISTWL